MKDVFPNMSSNVHDDATNFEVCRFMKKTNLNILKMKPIFSLNKKDH